MKIKRRLTINGKIYTYRKTFSKKWLAERLAKDWRQSGYNARVIPAGNKYRVYIRKRRK